MTDNQTYSDELPLEFDEPSLPESPQDGGDGALEAPTEPVPSPGTQRLCDMKPRFISPPSGQNLDPTVTDDSKFVVYDLEQKKRERNRVLKFSLIGSIVGAFLYALVAIISFGGGVRLGILALAFFSAFGARLGVEDDRHRDVQLPAAVSAFCGIFIAKLILAVTIIAIVGSLSPPLTQMSTIPESQIAGAEEDSFDEVSERNDLESEISAVRAKIPTPQRSSASSDASDLLGVFVPPDRVSVWGIFRALTGPTDVLIVIISMVLAAILAKPRY